MLPSSDNAAPVVVITGASAGVGRATAHAFARRGARLGLLARSAESLQATAREVRDMGGEPLAIPCDVADADAVEAAAAKIVARWGRIDTWVNNAMLTVYGPFDSLSADEFKRVTDVTYLGSVNGTRAALKRMKAVDRGTIIQVGSALSERSIPLQSAYCGAKGALNSLLDAIRTELIHEDSAVEIVIVQMPALNTPQFRMNRNHLGKQTMPVPPVYQPEVAAKAILYAHDHPHRRNLHVGLSTLQAVLGNKLMAPLLDRYMAKTAWEAQMIDEDLPDGREDNLWQPLPGDHGTRGPFTDQARSFSPELWAITHRGWIGAGLIAGTLALLAGWLRKE